MLDYPCANHPEREGELECLKCARWFCRECTRPLTETYDGPKGCVRCDGLLRKGVKPIVPDTTAQLVRRIASAEGALMVAFLSLPGIPWALGGVVGFLFFVLWVGILGGYCIQTIHHLEYGKAGLPFSADASDKWTIAGHALRGLALGAVVVFPPMLSLLVFPDAVETSVVLLFLGAALAPASLLAGVITRSTLNQLWPLAWLEVVTRAPMTYLRLLPWVYGSLFAWIGAALFFGWLFEPVAVLWAFFSPALHTTFALWMACLFGRFLQQELDTFGLA